VALPLAGLLDPLPDALHLLRVDRLAAEHLDELLAEAARVVVGEAGVRRREQRLAGDAAQRYRLRGGRGAAEARAAHVEIVLPPGRPQGADDLQGDRSGGAAGDGVGAERRLVVARVVNIGAVGGEGHDQIVVADVRPRAPGEQFPLRALDLIGLQPPAIPSSVDGRPERILLCHGEDPVLDPGRAVIDDGEGEHDALHLRLVGEEQAADRQKIPVKVHLPQLHRCPPIESHAAALIRVSDRVPLERRPV